MTHHIESSHLGLPRVEGGAAHVESMRIQLDQHDCGYVLAQRTGPGEEAARRMLIRAVARRHPGPESLRVRGMELLDRGR
jgi:hypothetical protein